MKRKGTCAHLKIDPDRDGVRRMRDYSYDCLASIPELSITLPASIRLEWPPRKQKVWKDDCAGCPLWEERQ